jgi:hypothetical protein
MILLVVVLLLVILHGPDGGEISINPMTVTTMRAARTEAAKQTIDGVACIITLTDGKFVSVREDCDTASAILQAR